MNGIKVLEVFNKYFPKDMAYSWDNVGLQVGTLNKEVNTILIALDLTKEVVNEAIENDVDLIITHHPLIFKPLKSINTDHFKGSIIESLIKYDIALYAAHTNFDVAQNGMDQILADMLGLQNKEHLETLNETAGLGIIGEIDEMSMIDFITFTKKVFNLEYAKFIGDINQQVKTVAISGGSGSINIQNAIHKQADIFITGDLTYHYAVDCKEEGLNALDVGHNIEKYFAQSLKDLLVNEGIDCDIIVSSINTNPYKLV